MPFHFEYPDKSSVNELLPDLFSLFYENMHLIVPFEKSYGEAFVEWSYEVLPALQKEPRKLVLMYFECQFVGFFMYYVNNGIFMMEEIQIKKEFQSSGIFLLFYEWLVKRLPADISFVEAFVNAENFKSQKILEHMGLSKFEDIQNERFLHYKGNYAVLLNKYGEKN